MVRWHQPGTSRFRMRSFHSRSGMTATQSALLAHRGVDAVRPAAGGRKIKTGEAEQDRGRAAVEERMDYRRARLEHVAEKIRKRHFARQNKSGKAAPQADDQQAAHDQFDGAGRTDQ